MALLKTKEVAKQLGVSQTTILRWVSRHPQTVRKDRFGHYVFGDSEVDALRRIKAEIHEGAATAAAAAEPAGLAEEEGTALEMPEGETRQSEAVRAAAAEAGTMLAEMERSPRAERSSGQVGAAPLPEDEEAPENDLLDRLKRLEASVSRKADEVVSIQLLEHRRELEEIRQTIKQLAASVDSLKKPPVKEAFPALAPQAPEQADRPKRRRFFRSLFPFG